MSTSSPEPEPESIYSEPTDYGCEKYSALNQGDHRYTPVHERVLSDTKLRTAAQYEADGGTLYTAGPDAFRTHLDDDDPIVVTFESVLTPEEIAHIQEVRTRPAYAKLRGHECRLALWTVDHDDVSRVVCLFVGPTRRWLAPSCGARA
jgi:hypothetical protein